MTNFDDPQYRLAKAISELSAKVKELEAFDNAMFEIKITTGDPAPRGSFHFVINTFDNNIKCYADGAWRTLASW